MVMIHKERLYIDTDFQLMACGSELKDLRCITSGPLLAGVVIVVANKYYFCPGAGCNSPCPLSWDKC